MNSLKKAKINTPIAIKLWHSDIILELADEAKKYWADAIVALNTYWPVLDFDIDSFPPKAYLWIESAKWWLSGKGLFHIALTDVADLVNKVKIPVIACWGVYTAEHVIKMIMAWAEAVQIYTAAHVRWLRAPMIFDKISKDLIKYLDKHSIPSINDLRWLAQPLLSQKTNLNPIIPEVIQDDCTWCDVCHITCLHDSISKDWWIYIIEDNCVWCWHCIYTCPHDAIK